MALVLRMTSTMPVLEAVTHINCLDEEVVEVVEAVSTEGGA